MRSMLRSFVTFATLTILAFASMDAARAFDLTGAWASSAENCSKVFTRKGRSNEVTFSNFSGLYGAGFIAEPNRLRGKFDKCTIKSRKDDGQNVNLLVGCASGIMVSNVQFFLKIVDDNRITRMFPGIDGMEITYHRCTI
jgi:hypothetical protein